MSTAVRYRRDGRTVASVTFSGAALPVDLPRGLRATQSAGRQGAELVLEPDHRVVAGSDFCGRLEIPHLRDNRVSYASLVVPPPDPWRWGDVRAMAASSLRLRLLKGGGSGAGPWYQTQRVLDRRTMDWSVMDRALGVARRLLANWPLVDTTEEGLLSLEVAGGLEDGVATERLLGSPTVPIARTAAGDMVPTRTVRSFGAVGPARSASVAAVARGLHAATRGKFERWGEAGLTTEQRAVRARILGSLEQVATQAEPDHIRKPDPPSSSWHPLFRDFYSTALHAMSRLHATGHGRDWFPLSPLWKLYEDWLAERVVAVVARVLGSPPKGTHTGTGRILFSWETGTTQVELHVQPSVAPTRRYSFTGRGYFTVVSTLRPDIVLAARSRGANARLLLIDAKDWKQIPPDALSSESSKYLWGVREVFDPVTGQTPERVPAVEGVVLVSPVGGPSSAHLPLGKATTVRASPYDDRTGETAMLRFDARLVRDWLLQLGCSP